MKTKMPLEDVPADGETVSWRKAQVKQKTQQVMTQLGPGTHQFTIRQGQRARRYVVHVPPSRPSPVPVVFAFHGAGGTARIMLHHSRWANRADVGGFVVVAPEGTPPNLQEKPSFRFNPQLWNLGGASTAAPTGHSDDVGFVRAILNELCASVDLDHKRVYATGFSNGAGLSFRLAVEMNDCFAAIGPIAGYPNVKQAAPQRPIPTFYMVGSADPLIPLLGGEVTSPWSLKPTIRQPVMAALEAWRSLCGFEQVSDPGDIDQEVIIGRAPGGAVLCYLVVQGLGHHWPGGKDVGVPQEVLGPRIKTFDATEKLWAFFTRYSLPG